MSATATGRPDDAGAQREDAPARALRVLQVTNMWPDAEQPGFGVFVQRQVESLERHGVECDVVYVRRDYPALRRRTRDALRAASFDVVHAHFGFSAVAVADVCLRARRPLVVSYCGGDLNGEEGSVRRRTRMWVGGVASRAVSFGAQGIIVKTPGMLAHLPAPVRRRAAVIPNGVDLATFAPMPRAEARARLGWNDDTVVLFGGRRPDPTKNYALAQAAVERLVAGGVQARLVPLEGVPHERVPLWLCAADAVLLTSLREGSPNVVKESMACNAPVVAVDVGDVAWLLAGVPNARVAAYDAQALADALAQVLGARAEGGRRRLEELRLDDASVAARLETLYRTLLPRGRH